MITTLTKESSQFNCNTTGDKVTFNFGRNAEIVGVKIISDTVGDANTGATVVLDRRVKAGSDTDRSNAIGTITIAASSTQGSVIYENAAFTSVPLVIDAGDQIILRVSSASTNSHTVYGILEYIDRPEKNSNLTDGVAG